MLYRQVQAAHSAAQPGVAAGESHSPPSETGQPAGTTGQDASREALRQGAARRPGRATAEEPYLAVEVDLDFAVLADLIAEVGVTVAPTREAIAVHDAPPAIFEPLARLLHLASDPVAARLFARDAVREMTYHALVGPHGDALQQIAMLHSPQARVAEAAAIMAAHLVDPVEIPELARRLGMSGTTLHRHFRTTTGSAPSTYYERLRLHEARRLGVGQQLTVAQAAAAVGYASAAHFSRDYKQAFGHAPSGDFRGRSDLRWIAPAGRVRGASGPKA